MSAFGKFLFGAAVTGAAAYGVYSFLQKYRIEVVPVDKDSDAEDADVKFAECAGEKAASDDDFEDNEGSGAAGTEGEGESGTENHQEEKDSDSSASPFTDEETETSSEDSSEKKDASGAGKAFDPSKLFDPEKAAEAAGSIRNAANRAYTTIQHGSQHAADVMKETVIPKGTEVVQNARKVVEETVIPKGVEAVQNTRKVVEETVIPKGAEVIGKMKEAIDKQTSSPEESTADSDVVDAEEVSEVREEGPVSEGNKPSGGADGSADSSDSKETDSSVKSEGFRDTDDSVREGTIEFFDDEG